MTQTLWSRLRRGILWFLFAWVLLIPKTLALRRRPPVWNAMRVCFGLLGAALAAAGWMWPGHRHVSLLAGGAVLILLALLISPERRRPSIDARAKELGAFVAVKGGRYQTAEAAWPETLLFIGPERLSLADPSLKILLEVPVAQLTLLRAEPTENGWKLHLAWENSAAALLYSGPFAEHFARVAESTARTQLPNALPILQ